MAKVPPADQEVAKDINTPEQSHTSPASLDIEKQQPVPQNCSPDETSKQSVYKSLGWLDRFLALWIFLAMAIGIILGNFVPNTGPALQKGKFVGVSIPIGLFPSFIVVNFGCIVVDEV